MKITHFSVDQRLKQHIQGYWLLEGECSEQTVEQFLFPVGAVEIIIHLKSPFLRRDTHQWEQENSTFIEGQQTGLLSVKQKGVIRTVGITLFPWATIALYQTSPHHFTNRRFETDEVDKSIKQIVEWLNLIKDDKMIPTMLNNYFLSKFKCDTLAFNPVDYYFIDLFHQSKYGNTIKELKKDWQFSSKYFERKCVAMLGTTAGELTKKRRMKAALNLMHAKNFKGLTDVAHSVGYFDQSHFIKDFRFYFNISPSQFLNGEKSLLNSFI